MRLLPSEPPATPAAQPARASAAAAGLTSAKTSASTAAYADVASTAEARAADAVDGAAHAHAANLELATRNLELVLERARKVGRSPNRTVAQCAIARRARRRSRARLGARARAGVQHGAGHRWRND